MKHVFVSFLISVIALFAAVGMSLFYETQLYHSLATVAVVMASMLAASELLR